jgi:hypothetical protein
VETADITLGSHSCFDSPPTLVWIQGNNWDNCGRCFILGNGSSIWINRGRLVGRSNTGSSICVLLLNLLTINPTYSTHSWPLEVTRVSLYSRNCHRVGIWCSCSLRHNTPSSMSIRVTSIIGLTYTSTLWSISCIGVRGCLLRQALTWNCRGSKGLLLLLLLGV